MRTYLQLRHLVFLEVYQAVFLHVTAEASESKEGGRKLGLCQKAASLQEGAHALKPAPSDGKQPERKRLSQHPASEQLHLCHQGVDRLCPQPGTCEVQLLQISISVVSAQKWPLPSRLSFTVSHCYQVNLLEVEVTDAIIFCLDPGGEGGGGTLFITIRMAYLAANPIAKSNSTNVMISSSKLYLSRRNITSFVCDSTACSLD